MPRKESVECLGHGQQPQSERTKRLIDANLLLELGKMMSLIELADAVIIVRGGEGELPPSGTVFSGAAGVALEDAAAYVPHGTIRMTTVDAILSNGGSVTLRPEVTRSGRINERHVDIIEGIIPSSFSSPFPNPVPKKDRIS